MKEDRGDELILRLPLSDNVVLRELDFNVSAGGRVTLIGPSGSGKTILRLLMTLEKLDGGQIWVDGSPLSHTEKSGQLVAADEKHLRQVRIQIGVVFQQFNRFAEDISDRALMFDQVRIVEDAEPAH